MSNVDMSEVVTRAILKEELRKAFEEFERRYDQKLDQKLEQKLEQKFAAFREVIREDMQSVVRLVLSNSERNLALALEPTKDLPDRVKTLEDADLPRRVSRLEAKVFPPKRATRRR